MSHCAKEQICSKDFSHIFSRLPFQTHFDKCCCCKTFYPRTKPGQWQWYGGSHKTLCPCSSVKSSVLYLSKNIAYNMCVWFWSRGSWVSIVSYYGLDDRAIGIDPRQRQEIFRLTSVSRPALWPAQPPVTMGTMVLSSGVGGARSERDAYHSAPSSAEVKNV
jgi:hypothetical protein